MSPEQLAGAPASATSDLFAFCVALWEALYGARPFAGGTAEELHAAMRTAPRPPRTSRRVPARVQALLLRGLNRDPARRPASMAEVLAVLEPRRRFVSKRALAAAAALATLAAAGAAWRRAHLCDGGDSALANAWNPAARQRVRDSLAKSGQTGAAENFAAVAATLDRFAAAWRAQLRDACEATNLRHEASKELLEARTHCLDLRAAELSGLIDVLDKADKSVASGALRTAESLTDVHACSASQVSRARVPVAGEKQAAEVRAIERELVPVAVLSDAGRYREAREKIKPLLERAAAAGYAPERSEVRYQDARLRYFAGDPAGAAKSAREALRDAEEGRDEWLASLAWNWLSVADLALGRSEAAEEDLSHSESLLSSVLKAPGDERLRDAQLHRLYSQRGAIYLARGRLAESADAFGRALASAERLGRESRSAAMTTYSLAVVLQKLGRWDEALALYQRSLALLEKLLGKSHYDLTLPLNGISSWMNNAGKSAEAVDEYRRILVIVEETLGKDNLRTVPYLNNLCESLGSAGRYDEAVATCERALAIREAALGPDSRDVALVLDTLGVVLRARGDSRGAVLHLSRAVAIWEKSDPNHIYAAEALTHLGQAMTDAGDAAGAVPLLERALTRRSAPPVNADDLAETRFALAQALFALGRAGDRARSLAEQARAVWTTMGASRAKELATLEEALLRENRRRQ
jgi:serine/threonine-protein kinase